MSTFTKIKQLRFKEVDITSKESITELGKFYTEVYMDCFPNADERETFDNLLLYLRQAEGAQDYAYHILLAMDENDNVVGGGVFDYFKATNAGVIEFLAVKPNMHTTGVGTQVYKKVYSLLTKDAYNCDKKKLSNIFCEIDSPEYSKVSIKRYLYFWNKHNYKHLDFSYIQPSLSSTQKVVEGLWLVVSNYTNEELSGEYVLQVLYDYMKFSMQIESPEQNEEYLHMKNELSGKIVVKMLPILQ